MLKNKSPEDINRVSNEELFTELTPKEASVIEGGATAVFLGMTRLPTDDETYSLYLNGEPFWKGKAGTSTFIQKGFDPLGILQLRTGGDGSCSQEKVIGEIYLSDVRFGTLGNTINVENDPNDLTDDVTYSLRGLVF